MTIGIPRRSRTLLLLAGLVYVGPRIWAQQAEISGFVNDPSGAPIARASVTIQNTTTNIQQNAVINGDGIYTFPLLPAGVYRLTVEAQGFDKQIVEDIKLGRKLT